MALFLAFTKELGPSHLIHRYVGMLHDMDHVLAAAIGGQASVIVTLNLRNLTADAVGAFGIEAQHPDEFVHHLLDLAAGAVVAAAESHWKSLRNPPVTADEYLGTLERQGLARSVAALRRAGMA